MLPGGSVELGVPAALLLVYQEIPLTEVECHTVRLFFFLTFFHILFMKCLLKGNYLSLYHLTMVLAVLIVAISWG